MGLAIPRDILSRWAICKPTIAGLYVFGSYANGSATNQSDLDLAFEFVDVDEPDAELISNASAWKSELTQLTGITVKDLYHLSSPKVQNSKVIRVFP